MTDLIGTVAMADLRTGAAASCKRQGARSGAALALAACFLAISWLASPIAAAGQQQRIFVLEIDGAIGPATTDYVGRGLDEARSAGAAALVLRIDTPGGLDKSMREINHKVLASPIPVIGYVAPTGARAASAGTYILYACHLAAMAPATNLGAATPIQLGAPSPLGREREEKDDKGKERDASPRQPTDPGSLKAVNDAVAYIRGLARHNGRNAEWAEEAVRKAASLSAEDALARGVVEIVAPDLPALLEQADGRTVSIAGRKVVLATAQAKIHVVEPNWRNRLLAVVTDPNVALILMMIGIYGIVFEFMNPGVVFPGVIGAICLLVGLFALNMLPISYAGLALLLLGLGFMVAEAFTPSFGILGIGGIVAFAAGAVVMFDEAPGFEIAPEVIAALTLTTAGFFLVALGAAFRARRHAVATGGERLIGSPGEVVRAGERGGWVRVHGEQWQARSVAAPLHPGARVRVTGREGLTLLVVPESEPRKET
jgi:membrane-bound serine protease (ClpP class)